MATPHPAPVLDAYGSPTAAALEAIECFEGSPEALVAYCSTLYTNGYVSIADFEDDWGRPMKRVSFATAGSSAAESVSGAVEAGTTFHAVYWARSTRGGLTEYEVPADHWSRSSWLGSLDRLPHHDDFATVKADFTYRGARVRTAHFEEAARVILDIDVPSLGVERDILAMAAAALREHGATPPDPSRIDAARAALLKANERTTAR